MNTSLSLTAIKKAIVNFLHRFHVLVFATIVLGGSAIVILILNSIIIQSGDSTNYVPQGQSSSFDQNTIKRIDELKTRNQSGDSLDLSNGRTNPFVE